MSAYPGHKLLRTTAWVFKKRKTGTQRSRSLADWRDGWVQTARLVCCRWNEPPDKREGVAGLYEISRDARSARRLQVTFGIAQHETTLKVGLPGADQVQQHPGLGLATTAVSCERRYATCGVMRAEAECVDGCADSGKVLLYPCMQPLYGDGVIQPPGDAGLVADDEDQEPAVIQQSNSLSRAFDPLVIVDAMYIAFVHVEGAVTVEESGWPGGG